MSVEDYGQLTPPEWEYGWSLFANYYERVDMDTHHPYNTSQYYFFTMKKELKKPEFELLKCYLLYFCDS